jgi:hypothetical protein
VTESKDESFTLVFHGSETRNRIVTPTVTPNCAEIPMVSGRIERTLARNTQESNWTFWRAWVNPDFDSSWIRRVEFPNRGKELQRRLGRGVYLGAQASCRMGGGCSIFRDFRRLSASGGGSVTCQTVPFGLNN